MTKKNDRQNGGIKRQLYHIRRTSSFTIGIDRFMVMFPSVLLVSKLSSTSNGITILDVSQILLACGIGTLIFVFGGSFLKNKVRIPFFIGPSFCYIGLTSYVIGSLESSSPEIIKNSIVFGYISSGILLLIIAAIYKWKPSHTTRLLNFAFPNSIMGASVSLIGLELASIAAGDSGFNAVTGHFDISSITISLITLAIIIIFSVTRLPFIKNAAITLGIIFSAIIVKLLFEDYTIERIILSAQGIINKGIFAFPNISSSSVITLFKFGFPPSWISILIAIIPSTLVAFSESIGRITVLDGMYSTYNENKPKDLLGNSLIYHSISAIISAFIGTVPTSIYAENIAVMELNANTLLQKKASLSGKLKRNLSDMYSVFSFYPYLWAAGISIAASCLIVIQNILGSIPKPVWGGMEFFIFALISAPGIQMMVEKYVDYTKITNHILTGSVLLAGISGFSIHLGAVDLKGMSLGLFIGVILNLVFKLFAYFGWLNEQMSLYEVIEICRNYVHKGVTRFDLKYRQQEILSAEADYDLNADKARDLEIVQFNYTNSDSNIKIEKSKGYIIVSLHFSNAISDELQSTFTDDYKLVHKNNTYTLNISNKTKKAILKNIIKEFSKLI
ncbi:MAG: hypothetical protein LBM65_04265 [Oscillospiraceae bacterium]|jgi:uracil permease|nr:hypothetical protein [Oscillospiraceae bacterium]